MEDAGYPPDGVSYALLLEVMMETGNVESCMDILHHIEHGGNDGSNDGDGGGNDGDGSGGKERELSLSSLMTLKDPSMQRAMRRLCILVGQGQGQGRADSRHDHATADQTQGPGLEAGSSGYYEVKPDWEAAAVVARLMAKTMLTASSTAANANTSARDSVGLTNTTSTVPLITQEENASATATDIDKDPSNTDQIPDSTTKPTAAAIRHHTLPHGVAIFDEPILPKFFRVRIKNIMKRAKR